jgi:hypothetical protein
MTAEDERERAFKRVYRAAWWRAALWRVERVPAGWEGTGEDLRRIVMNMVVGGLAMMPPHHHNAWGALTMTCIRHGLLEKTGRYRKMRTLTSHARSSEIHRRTNGVLK